MKSLDECFMDAFFARVDAGEEIMIPVDGAGEVDQPDLIEFGKCRVCGCTDFNACPGGCFWVAPDLCSVCYHEMIDEEGP